jgi:exodeoxyribonuclease VII small subunit
MFSRGMPLKPLLRKEAFSAKSPVPKTTPMSEKITYTEAFDELQALVSEIETGEISVDQLSEKVKRAAFLIKTCKQKLSSTEEDVDKILKELEGE